MECRKTVSITQMNRKTNKPNADVWLWCVADTAILISTQTPLCICDWSRYDFKHTVNANLSDLSQVISLLLCMEIGVTISSVLYCILCTARIFLIQCLYCTNTFLKKRRKRNRQLVQLIIL